MNKTREENIKEILDNQINSFIFLINEARNVLYNSQEKGARNSKTKELFDRIKSEIRGLSEMVGHQNG